jgi:hypothetical protein
MAQRDTLRTAAGLTLAWLATALASYAGDAPGGAAAAATETWDVVYTGTALPAAPWHPYRSDTGAAPRQPSAQVINEIRAGALLLADRGSAEGDHLFYNCYWGMLPDEDVVLETRLRLLSGWCEVSFSNGRWFDTLRFLPDRIEVRQAGLRYALDTTAAFHTYRIALYDKALKVYVDGELRLDGQMVYEVVDNQTQVYFGGADNAGQGEALWEYVRFRRTPHPGLPPRAEPRVDLDGPLFRVLDRQVCDNGTAAENRIKTLYGAMYPEVTGQRLIGYYQVSEDNGRTWAPWTPTPDFAAGLPQGYRREPFPPVLDPRTGRIIQLVNAMDTPGLDPKLIEPAIAGNTYYLRYRVSADGGRTWLFDEPVVHAGDFTPAHPFAGVQVGQNGFYFGDSTIPVVVVTRDGSLLLAPSATVVGEGGKLYDPTGWGYYEVLVVRGRWQEDGRLRWTASERVRVPVELSTRGVCEATLAEFEDGRLLLVMRGSNASRRDLPARRWAAVSQDGGQTWSTPQPWTYEDGAPFYSCAGPSAFIRHSSGRVFWTGNISERNGYGNDPRWPLVIAEVDPATLTLRRGSVQILDTRTLADERLGRLVINHGWRYEDRETGELVFSYPRMRGPLPADWQRITFRLRLL